MTEPAPVALVTGASGFLGTRLCQDLRHRGWRVHTLSRSPGKSATNTEAAPEGQSIGLDLAALSDGTAPAHLQQVLADSDVVFHLAGLAHQTEKQADSNRYMRINALATGRLAALAAQAGVRRFILVSSIKAMTGSSSQQILTPEHPARPQDAYGRSKLAGEQSLIAECQNSSMQSVIFRPPLVYGAGARANLALLMQAVHSKWPLPLKNVRNRRAMIGRTTLSQLLIEAAGSARAANRVYLPADMQPSTPALITQIAAVMNSPARLFGLPAPVLSAACQLPGIGPRLLRLTQTLALEDPHLQADSQVIRHAGPSQDLKDMVQVWLASRSNG